MTNLPVGPLEAISSTTPCPLKVLLVEDSEVDAGLLLRELKQHGYTVAAARVANAADLHAALTRQTWDLVLSDFAMPGFSGLDALQMVKASGLDLPFILISGTIGEEVAVTAMKAGAHDYLLKDRLSRLAPAVERELRNAKERLARRQAEEQIRQLSRAVEQSPASIVITDTKGAIEYVNPKFTQVTGYTLEEVRGQNPRLLKGDKTTPKVYHRLWQTITQGREWCGEFHNRKKNGKLYWEFASISPIVDEAGQITHFLAVKEDITERKLLEEQLRQAQKLESIGQLAGGVAHDYNNVLAATMMHLNFLQLNTSFDVETQETLKALVADARRSANLTRQLLMFSRRSVLEVKRVDLNELVTTLLKMLNRLIEAHIAVQFDRCERLPTVEADAGMLEQVLMNLVINARDAMPKGGKIIIRTEPIQVETERSSGSSMVFPGPFICLSVADTGCGMDEATQKRIFEPFFTTKEPGKGTGLGLATVYGIVSQHKGWVEVESELGKGTTFKVFLPATTQGIMEPTRSGKMAVAEGHEMILLVEDEASLRGAMATGLRRLGYQLLEAGNGQEAMKIWQDQGPQIDLLFSDMVMPEGMTGLELAEKLKQEKPNLKVLLSSGYNVEVVGKGKPTAGGIRYLQKPYELEVLAKTIRDCLEGDGGKG